MSKEPIYDGGFSEKIEQAIAEGLIARKIDSDGVPIYALTRKGLIHWQIESLRKNGMFG